MRLTVLSNSIVFVSSPEVSNFFILSSFFGVWNQNQKAAISRAVG